MLFHNWLFAITFVALLGTTYALPDYIPKFFKAKTIEDIQRLVEAEKSKRSKSRDELLRGRRTLADGTLEVSHHILADEFGGHPGFYHSVASGDPLTNAVIIWTRYTPVSVTDEVVLELSMAEVNSEGTNSNDLLDPKKNRYVFQEQIVVTSKTDFVAKLDVTGLKSNTQYVYAFTDGIVSSDVGLTKTIPTPEDGVESLKYATVSCAAFRNGYFHAYDVASTIQDLDLWIHLGDYIYEHGTFYADNSNAAEKRNPLQKPAWESIDLQDYRNRHASYISNDEGLRNLRRISPLIAIWDDHETFDNSYGNMNGAGGLGHQPTCPVDQYANVTAKNAAKCDRDEGDAVVRGSAAWQAYLEWLPIRYVPGSMGPLTTPGTMKRSVDWGNLATIVMFDSRFSYRSEEPTVAGLERLATYGYFAAFNPDYTKYSVPGTPENIALQGLTAGQVQIRDDPKFTMAGDYLQFLEEKFNESKENGKPWQIWANSISIGHNVLVGLENVHLDLNPNLPQASVDAFRNYVSLVLQKSASSRAFSAMAAVDMEFNRDDYGGFGAERSKILAKAKENGWNMIVLGADLHDAYAWELPEGGLKEGESVAVYLGCASVTSNGLEPTIAQFFDPIKQVIGGEDALQQAMRDAMKRQNPNLVLMDFQYSGFSASVLTASTHTTEYFGVPTDAILMDYDDARGQSGGITSEKICVGAVQVQSDTPGSLESISNCSVIAFGSVRDPLLSIPVPVEGMPLRRKKRDTIDCGMTGCTVKYNSKSSKQSKRTKRG